MYWFEGLGSVNENGEQLYKISDDTDGVVEEFTASEIENAVRHGNFIRYREGVVESRGKYIGKRFKSNYFEYIVIAQNPGGYIIFLDDFGICLKSKIKGIKTIGNNYRYIKELFEKKIYRSNNYGDFIITFVESATKIYIKFIPSGITSIVRYEAVKRGNVGYNKLQLFGFIFNISPTHYLYNLWTEMGARCYLKSATEYVRYGGKGIYVTEDFKDGQKFVDWYESQPNFKFRDDICMNIDKDLLGKGYYGSDSCCLLPYYINSGFLIGRTENNLPRFCLDDKDYVRCVIHLRGTVESSFDIKNMPESDDYYYKSIMRFFDNRDIVPTYSKKILIKTAKRWYVAKQMWQEYWCNEFKECLDKGWILQWQYDKLVAMTDIDIAD